MRRGAVDKIQSIMVPVLRFRGKSRWEMWGEEEKRIKRYSDDECITRILIVKIENRSRWAIAKAQAHRGSLAKKRKERKKMGRK